MTRLSTQITLSFARVEQWITKGWNFSHPGYEKTSFSNNILFNKVSLLEEVLTKEKHIFLKL